MFTTLLEEDAGFVFLSDEQRAEVRDGAIRVLQEYEKSYFNYLATDDA